MIMHRTVLQRGGCVSSEGWAGGGDRGDVSYSPASHHSWGVAPDKGDPFEEATVRVDQSGLRGAGQGLFVTRHVR